MLLGVTLSAKTNSLFKHFPEIQNYLPASQPSTCLRKTVAACHDHLPLHAKDVACSVKFAALDALPSADPAVVAEYEYQRGWITDDTRYKTVPVRNASEVPVASLTDAHVETLLQRKLIAEIDPSEVRGGVRMFTVPELAKNRLRPIRHTADINDALPDPHPDHPVRMITKSGIIKLVHGGDYMAAHDLAGLFDQIQLTNKISRRMCFRSGGKVYALTCLPMGQCQSVGVASAITRRLLDFAHRSTHVEIVIDNVIFVGDRDAVITDSIEFRRRCAAAGAVLNDLDVPVEHLAVQEGDWCGLHLDLKNKTVALTSKSQQRTAMSWDLRHDWTWRGYMAMMGLLFWSYGIVDVHVHRFFALMQFLSRVSADLAAHPELWDAPASIWPSALSQISEWVQLIAANTPRPVPIETEPEWTVATDASRFGWGYVAFSHSTGEVRTHGAKWDAYMEEKYGDQLGHSTVAEPHGAVNSVLHLFAPRDGVRRIRLATDNSATRWSFGRGFSTHSMAINMAIGRLRALLPSLIVTMTYLPGEINPADGPSRGRPLSPEQAKAAANSLRQVMG